ITEAPTEGDGWSSAGCLRGEADRGSNRTCSWCYRESDCEGCYCDSSRCGGKFGVGIGYVNLDSESSRSGVGMGLSVRVSCSSSDLRRSVAEAPGEGVGWGAACCLCGEADRCSNRTCSRCNCESDRKGCSGNCD